MSASLHNRNDFLGTCVSMASIEGQNSSVHLVDETSIERDAIQKTNVVTTTTTQMVELLSLRLKALVRLNF